MARTMGSMHRTRGFTLVELLVVVLVTAIVMGLLFAVLARSRERSRRTTCANNLGFIVKTMHIYACHSPNHGNFPLYLEHHNADGLRALNMLFIPAGKRRVRPAFELVKDHLVFSCPSAPTDTRLIPEYTGDVATMTVWMTPDHTNYGYDPGHCPVHAEAGVLSDHGTRDPMQHHNSLNHQGDGQNVAFGSGMVKWVEEADRLATKDANDKEVSDNIFTDDIRIPDFPEELETNIIP